jgi:hypothetical protein
MKVSVEVAVWLTGRLRVPAMWQEVVV